MNSPANIDAIKLTALDNAELRYCVRISTGLFNKLKMYFRLSALGKDLVDAIITEEHDWKDHLLINTERYEVAYRECSYDSILNDIPEKRYFISVRRAKDNRTRIALIVPWDSYAAERAKSNEDTIPWLEY